MKLLVFILSLIIGIVSIAAQDLSDIVNRYSSVRSIDTTNCYPKLTVASSIGFAPGDRILIIQMKGALSSLADGSDFGRVTAIGAAGRFQFATVQEINGNEVTVMEKIMYPFNTFGAVQIVKVATGDHLRVVAPVYAAPWDGAAGGVVVIEAAQSLTLLAAIRADSVGFAGGTRSQGGTECNILYLVEPDNSVATSRRGQSIVEVPSWSSKGRGAVANGGGGGSGTNAGGGGGSSAGAGGRGGDQWTGCGRYWSNGGFGGKTLSVDPSDVRLFLGGGGGAGHQNNDAGTSGATGGGIIIIRSPSINGGGNSISASGGSVSGIAGFDGAGGGGGGGMILMDATSCTNLSVNANGGDGGSILFNVAHGPGGGGGGGAIFTTLPSLPITVRTSVSEGTHGLNLGVQTEIERQLGAESGAEGRIATSVRYGKTETIVPLTTSMMRTLSLCNDSVVTFTTSPQNGEAPYYYQWENEKGDVIGTQSTVTTLVRPPTKIRLFITDTRGCVLDDSIVITALPSPKVVIPNVDLGSRPECDTTFTFIVNASVATSDPFTINSYSVSDPSIAILSPKAGAQFSSTFPISVRFTGGASGKSVVTVNISGPCDTTVTFNVTWKNDTATGKVAPTVFDLGRIEVCDSLSSLPPITIVYQGKPASLISTIHAGAVRTAMKLPMPLLGHDTISVPRLWQGPGAHRGRLGLVIYNGSCTDTFWIDITDTTDVFLATLSPHSVVLGADTSCDSSSPARSFDLLYQGSNAILQQIISSGDLRAVSASPQSMMHGRSITITCSLTGYGNRSGRAGLVLTNGTCIDTVWIDVTQSVDRPSYSATSVSMGDIIACRDSLVSMTSVLRSSLSTTTFTIVDVVSSSPLLSTSLSRGMQISPDVAFRVSLATPTTGRFVGTIQIHVQPCDTVLTVNVDGNVVEASMNATSAATFSASQVGSTEVRRIYVWNTGTTSIMIDTIIPPTNPFLIQGTQRTLPTQLIAGDSMWVDVLFATTVGMWLDSLTVVSGEPCSMQSTTLLRSDVQAITRLWMPRVMTSIGVPTEMPVILEERPTFASNMRPDYEIIVRMVAKDVSFSRLTDTETAQASVVHDGNDIVVTIRDTWSGSDTIATMILLPLLSGTDSVDVRFDRSMPFRWIGLPSQVKYQDGRLVLSDVCAANYLASIRYGGLIQAIEITPHPASDRIRISVRLSAAESTTIRVTDLNGQTIAESVVPDSETIEMDASAWPSGSYRVLVSTPFEVRTAPLLIFR